jgi:C1A family cysteine protease
MASKPRKFNNGGGIGRVSGLMSGDQPTACHDNFIIDDESLLNPIIRDKVMYPVIDGEPKGCGLIKRDWAKHPAKTFGLLPSTMKVLSRTEISDRIKEQDREQSSLWHIRMRSGPNGGKIPALDQNGQGYCWAYSTTMAVVLVRAKMGLPYVRLSAHAVGCKVKGFRDEGGWCGLSAQFIRENGVPSIEYWAEKSMSRSHDKPETWANAQLHKIVSDYADLTRPVYDHNLTLDQMLTCLVLNQPVPQDYDEWGHSICGIRAREPEPGSITREIINSWTDNWGDQGCGQIRTSWSVDGAIAVLEVPAS